MARKGIFDPALSKYGIFDPALDPAGIFGEEFVEAPTSATIALEESEWDFKRIVAATVVATMFTGMPDELPVTGGTTVVDDDYQWLSFVQLNKPITPVWTVEDESPHFVLDEDAWQIFQPNTGMIIARMFSDQDEIIPKPDEIYQWVDQSVPARVVLPQIFHQDEIALLFMDEETWQQPYSVRPSVAVLSPTEDGDIPPQATTFVEDEIWVQPYVVKSTLGLPTIVDDEIFQQPAALLVDEVYVWTYTPDLVKPTVTLWQIEDEIGTPTVFRPDEEPWQPGFSISPRVLSTLWMTDDEIPSTLKLDEDFWQPGFNVPPRVIPTLWAVDDEVIFVLRLEEDLWFRLGWQPSTLSREISTFADDIVPQRGWPEDYWWAFNLQKPTVVVTSWNLPDEVFQFSFTPDTDRTYIVGPEDRLYLVDNNSRIYIVASEDRTYYVPPADRTQGVGP